MALTDKVQNVKCILFSDFENADAFDEQDFNTIIGEDITLVSKARILTELEDIYEQEVLEDDTGDGALKDLIEEVKTVPDDVYIRLED